MYSWQKVDYITEGTESRGSIFTAHKNVFERKTGEELYVFGVVSWVISPLKSSLF
jgi:hypothetical protein